MPEGEVFGMGGKNIRPEARASSAKLFFAVCVARSMTGAKHARTILARTFTKYDPAQRSLFVPPAA
jgi:hypothetical protein